MCCFSKPVRFVGATKIFARRLPRGMQALVYAMDVAIDSDLAMVLPLPTPPGVGEDAVRFVDLHGYATFFDDLATAFPPVMQPASRGALAFAPPAAKSVLVVHDVGDFEASFVPTRSDFARLDERFRLPDGVWDAMPRYHDHGFAVFRLKPKTKLVGRAERQTIHPMAFVFPSREPEALFFPTVHVHDGTIHPKAKFDHSLYAQADSVLGATLGWTRAFVPLGERVDVVRASGLVDAEAPAFVLPLHGELDNDDVLLRPPADLAIDDLEARGECFAFRAKGTHAYTFGSVDARFAAWRRSAANLGRIARSIRGSLDALERNERASLRLASLTADLAPHFINGRELWSGTSYLDGARGSRGGAGYVTFRPFSERVEPQEIVLGFSELPDEPRLSTILATLTRIVDLAADA